MPSKKDSGDKAGTVKKSAERKDSPGTAKKSFLQNPLVIDVINVIIIGICILILLSFFMESSSGFIGGIISGLFKGLFGLGSYIFPISLICFCFYILFSENKKISLLKVITGSILFLSVVTLIHVIKYSENIQDLTFVEFVKMFWGESGVIAGGLTGAAIGTVLIKLVGLYGAYVILIIATLASLMLLTGKSIFKLLHDLYFDLKERAVYEDEYIYEDEDEYKEPTAVKKPEIGAGALKELPPRKKAKINKPVTFKIENPGSGLEEPRKILLISEEISEKRLDKTDGDRYEVLEPVKKHTDKDIEREEIYIGPKPNEIVKEMILDIDGEDVWEEQEEQEDDGQSVGKELTEDEFLSKYYKEPKIIQAKKREPVYEEPPWEENIEIEYEKPPIHLLVKNTSVQTPSSKAQILDNAKKLEETLKSFGVTARVVEICTGPTVTRYELSPGQGVKVSKISNLSDDLALNLAAAGIRIEAPIPGKSVVGIEVPNKEIQQVFISEVICDETFQKFPSKIAFGLGKDITGDVIVADIGRMPHLLIAGATGSGKSVCINTLITSILYKSTPDEVKLLMIDPKVVELSVYNGIPHLLIPVVTDAKKAAGALNWAVQEMINRYNYFAEASVRDLNGYNEYKKERGETDLLPRIVIIIDELADLMMATPKEVEEAICRLAQMARAAGLHLIIATQRPSVDVITGVIKANVPSRLAFSVSSGTDSRTILDMTGAEKLLGKGDMLFNPIGANKPIRVQGAFISDKEVEAIVNFLKKDGPVSYDQTMIDRITTQSPDSGIGSNGDSDEFTEASIDFVVKKGKASVSMLQRQFRIGYNRAARIIEELEDRGIVGEEDGSKPRQVLMTKYEWQEYKSRQE